MKTDFGSWFVFGMLTALVVVALSGCATGRALMDCARTERCLR